MSGSYEKVVDKQYRDKPIAEILAAPPDALLGVSKEDAERLKCIFGINTVAELAENPIMAKATALLAASGVPAFDVGPPPSWEVAFSRLPEAAYAAHSSRYRLAFGPVYYRGRLDGTARLLIIGQDPSTNEILAQRIFVGQSGRRLQGFLAKAGFTRSYMMLNTFAYSIFGQFDTELKRISLESPILNFRNSLLDKAATENPIKVVVAVGLGAAHAVENWPGKGAVPVVKMQHPSAHDEEPLLESWNEALVKLHHLVEPDEDGARGTPYGTAFVPGDEAAIPAADLPFGVPRWHGEGRGMSRRDGNEKIIWQAP